MSFAYVKIYHGPCDSFDTVEHKPQKLKGLRDRLQKRGYRVDFIPVDYINYCVVEMCGHEVFRCNLKNLAFNTPFELDTVSQRAIAAVEEAASKFKRARGYLWFWTLIEQEIFMRSKFAPADTWLKHMHNETYASCFDCIKCCGILCEGLKKDEDENQPNRPKKPEKTEKPAKQTKKRAKLTMQHDDQPLKFKL